MLDVNTDLSKVFLQSENNWKTEATQNGITVRQLVGMEAEFLEANCKNVAEWIACMMAFQLSYSNHEHLSFCLIDLTRNYLKNNLNSVWISLRKCQPVISICVIKILII